MLTTVGSVEIANVLGCSLTAKRVTVNHKDEGPIPSVPANVD
jgi:hypothetical protein